VSFGSTVPPEALGRSDGQKSTVGGFEPTPQKKLKGARFATPSRLTVETSAMGRGTIMPVSSLYICRGWHSAGLKQSIGLAEERAASMQIA
jgi:hypothetical protein